MTSYGSSYNLVIVERQAMQQQVVAKAEALKGGLAQEGHVEVPGIFFDFGKSEVKPESEAALKEIARLLPQNPAMRVWVVGTRTLSDRPRPTWRFPMRARPR